MSYINMAYPAVKFLISNLYPRDVQLMYAEHMLFYASEKYPLEDSYSKYITEVTEFIYSHEVMIFMLLLS